MNKFESKEPKERIISSSKGKGSITFFNDHLFNPFNIDDCQFFRKRKINPIKKGSLLVDVFSSNKSNEIQKVLKLLNHYVQGEKDR